MMQAAAQDNGGNTYTISQAAQMIDRSTQTIVLWEKNGLITFERNNRGWRIITEKDINRLEEIKEEMRQNMMAGVRAMHEARDGKEDEANGTA